MPSRLTPHPPTKPPPPKCRSPNSPNRPGKTPTRWKISSPRSAKHWRASSARTTNWPPIWPPPPTTPSPTPNRPTSTCPSSPIISAMPTSTPRPGTTACMVCPITMTTHWPPQSHPPPHPPLQLKSQPTWPPQTFRPKTRPPKTCPQQPKPRMRPSLAKSFNAPGPASSRSAASTNTPPVWPRLRRRPTTCPPRRPWWPLPLLRPSAPRPKRIC